MLEKNPIETIMEFLMVIMEIVLILMEIVIVPVDLFCDGSYCFFFQTSLKMGGILKPFNIKYFYV